MWYDRNERLLLTKRALRKILSPQIFGALHCSGFRATSPLESRNPSTTFSRSFDRDRGRADCAKH